MAGYCEPDDVRKVLQDSELSGPTNTDIVTATIEGVSQWLRRQSHHHWYDSSGTSSDTVPTSPRTASTIALDVPSSPHRQDRQLQRADSRFRYPVTKAGPYAKLRLPRYDVESIDTLEVRNRGGGVEDWTTATDKVEGRGEDYYVQIDGTTEYGTSHLFVRAASIGPRVDFDDLLTVDVTYGVDAAESDWADVRQGVANLTAAQLVTDDDVLTAIPDNGQLVNLETQRQGHLNDAVSKAWAYLKPYLGVAVQ